MQGEACGRCVRACRVEHGDGTATDWHFSHGTDILPVKILAVGDEVAMTVGHINVRYSRKNDRFSSRQRNALDGDNPFFCREEISPPDTINLGEYNVSKSCVRLAIEENLLSGA
jgi:hypothetical protein